MTALSQSTITAADLPGLPTRVLLDLHRLATANRAATGAGPAMADRGDRPGDESEGRMEVTRGEIHPGAALFTEEARKAVAEGALFEGWPTYSRPDGCCVVGALLRAQWPEHADAAPEFPVNSDLAEFLIERGALSTDPEDGTYAYDTIKPILRLTSLNDRGEYAGERGRANLRRDLLGGDR